jgi:hypothetical protein
VAAASPDPTTTTTEPTDPDSTHDSNPRRWAILAVLSAVAFMAQLDFFIVNVALAGIGDDFPSSSLSEVSWVLSAYAIIFASFLVLAGALPICGVASEYCWAGSCSSPLRLPCARLHRRWRC